MSNTLTSTLHTLNKTARDNTLNLKLSQTMSDSDDVVLIEDGVYQCLALFTEHHTEGAEHWPQLAKTIYALKDDALARGIPLTPKGIIFITYEEFVKLSLSHQKVVSWY